MADKKEKIVSYRRANWIIDNPASATLEALLKQAGSKLTTAEDRTIFRGGQEMVLADLRVGDGGHYVHVTVDTPGDRASVVPKARKKLTEIKVGTVAPPSDSEFMDGDAALYVNENHVCLCTTGIQDGSVSYFLRELFKKANLRHDADKFELKKVADASRLKLLQSQGAKEIHLNAVVSKATLHYNKRQKHTIGVLGAVAKLVRPIYDSSENDVNEDAMEVDVILVTNGARKGQVLGAKRMQILAKDLLQNSKDDDDEYDYAIITNTGQKISRDEIFIKSKVHIKAKGKSFDRDPAFKELFAFFKNLKSAGILET